MTTLETKKITAHLSQDSKRWLADQKAKQRTSSEQITLDDGTRIWLHHAEPHKYPYELSTTEDCNIGLVSDGMFANYHDRESALEMITILNARPLAHPLDPRGS